METLIVSPTHTLKEAVDTFFLAARVEGKRKSTQEFYHFTVGKFYEWLGDVPLSSVNTFIIRKFINSLEQKGLSLTTISNSIRALKTFFSFLKREELIQKSPCENIQKPRLPK